MKRRICKVIAVEIAGSHRLRVGFDDGLVREIDFLPVLAGAMNKWARELERRTA